jgi:CelD/BcsL family acetyltransferase involved in cellulose biosynthesis
MTSFKAGLVADLPSFEALRGEWNDLVENMEKPEIFYLWEWNFHYFRRFREGDRLLIIVIRDAASDRIAGIAPFRIRKAGRFIKVVESIVVDLADYRNILVHRAHHRGAVIRAVFDFLHEHGASWDVIDLSQLCSRDATTVQMLNAAQHFPDWNVRVQVLTPIAVRDLAGGRVAENRRQVSQVRNRLRTLQKRGFTVHIGCRDIDRYWPAFCELHRAAWDTSALHDPRGRQFFDDLRQAEGLADRIEFSFIAYEGRPVAMHFGFVDRRKVYFYMPAMDRAFHRERVGAALLYALLDHYQGTHECFDFLRGLESYKTWYTDDLDMNMRLVIGRSTSLAAFAYNARDATRRYATELGLPKGIVQMARRWISRLKGRRAIPPNG